MRDLKARLRDIVRGDSGSRLPEPAPGIRDLTYVADLGGAADGTATIDAAAVAAALGGGVHDDPAGRFVVIDRRWDADDWHGRSRVGAFAPMREAPLGLFDARLGPHTDWAGRVVFFDIETTGLSGGAGTLAFLVGCGWFEGDSFRVRQFFLHGPAGERAMLGALARVFDEATLLVTYNGRTFDVPTMETRWAFHRTASPAGDLPHCDMLPVARRLWRAPGRDEGRGRTEERRGEREDDGSCRLTALERTLLGFHRIGDVPGFEIPARYFHFLRTGDAAAVAGVLEHNQLDLLSLAALTSRAMELAHRGPAWCRDEREAVGLGRLYERGGDTTRAAQAYELASKARDREVRAVACARLAELLRRDGRHHDAALAWEQVLADVSGGARMLSRLEQRAAEGLAIHLEHRVRDPGEARRYADLLRRHADGRARRDAEHRLGRLDRKLRDAGDTTGGPEAARLFDPDVDE